MLSKTNDEMSLHDQIKLADKEVQRATDDLEVCRFNYRDEPSDRTKQKVMKAKLKLDNATDERDELLDQLSNEEWF